MHTVGLTVGAEADGVASQVFGARYENPRLPRRHRLRCRAVVSMDWSSSRRPARHRASAAASMPPRRPGDRHGRRDDAWPPGRRASASGRRGPRAAHPLARRGAALGPAHGVLGRFGRRHWPGRLGARRTGSARRAGRARLSVYRLRGCSPGCAACSTRATRRSPAPLSTWSTMARPRRWPSRTPDTAPPWRSARTAPRRWSAPRSGRSSPGARATAPRPCRSRPAPPWCWSPTRRTARAGRPADETLMAEIAESRLFARGSTSLAKMCEALARRLGRGCPEHRTTVMVAQSTGGHGHRSPEPTVRRRARIGGRGPRVHPADDGRVEARREGQSGRSDHRRTRRQRDPARRFPVRGTAGQGGAHDHPRGGRLRPAAAPGRPSGAYESCGGLLIVETLADRWGTRLSESGKTVWAELAINAN